MTLRYLLDTSIVSAPMTKTPPPHLIKRLEALGRPAPFVDGQIAAIAHANGLALITLNVKDFARFKELDVADWSKRHGRT